MPYKASEPRRHKFPRARYKVTNWPEYDRALQQRGKLTVWVTPEALAAWHPPRTRTDDQRRGRGVPGRPAARADPWPPRLGDGGRCLRWRSRLPGRGRAPARSAHVGGHPAALNRGAEPSRGHGTQPGRAAHPNDSSHGTPRMAEDGRLRPAVARGNRHVPLQGHHRQ